MTQEGGSNMFGWVNRKNMTKDDYKMLFQIYRKNSFVWDILNSQEYNKLIDILYNFIKKNKRDVKFTTMLTVSFNVSQVYFENHYYYNDLKREKINLLTLKKFTKLSKINIFGDNKDKVYEYGEEIWILINKEKDFEKIRKSFNVHVKSNYKNDFIKYITIYFKDDPNFFMLPTYTRNKLVRTVYLLASKKIEGLIRPEREAILKNVLKKYIIENKALDQIEKEYDFLDDDYRYYEDDSSDPEFEQLIRDFAENSWKKLSEFLVINNKHPLYSEASKKRKEKIKAEKEKLKKQAADAKKRAKEIAKKEAEKRKNRKNNKFCKNEIEFITQEDIEDIPTDELTFIKLDKNIFCLDKESFKNMVKYAKDQKVRGNCKPAVRNQSLECEWFYPINIGQNIYISEQNYKILDSAMKMYDNHRYFILKDKKIVDFTTGLHIMSEKSGKDNVYKLLAIDPFNLKGGAYKLKIKKQKKKAKKPAKKLAKKK